MSANTDQLIDCFAAMVKGRGVPIRAEDNAARLSAFEARLPKRIPPSFESFLSRYSFRAFDVLGITLFGWDSASSAYIEEASAPKNSLSELLIPAGYVQIGRPATGEFDAICFDLNHHAQNREYGVVQVDHEDILCNWKVRVTRGLWPSFVKLAESALSTDDPQVHYEQHCGRITAQPEVTIQYTVLRDIAQLVISG